MARPLQVMDLNSLSYLYTRLGNKIEEHTTTSKAELDSALDNVNSALSRMESDYLKKVDASSTYLTQASAASTYLSKTDASSTYATKTELKNKILYGTSVPSSLAEGQLYLVYE